MCSSSSCCSKDHVSLEHDDPNLFDRSQYCPQDKVSVWYLIYRVLVALIFAAGITAQFVNSNLGAKWFIYMTDQGICFLFLHFLLDACIVVARFTWEKSHPEYASYHANESLSGTYKLSWVLNSCFFNVALFISVIYWTVLHKFVMEAHLLKNEAAVYLNIFLHAVNSIACLIDIFITARPWKFFHFVYPICFGLYYTAFSLIYWGAGGVGVCYTTDLGHPTATVKRGEFWCDPFIYPILDWQSNPAIAAGVLAGGCIVLPIFHAFWMGLAKIRQMIFSCTCGRGMTDYEERYINPQATTSL